MKTHTGAVLWLTFAIVLISTNGVLIKWSSWQAITLNAARSLIAAAVFLVYLRRPKFTWSRVQVGGAVAYALMIITFVQAMKWTTAANAVFLQYTAPLWVALFGIWLLGERPQRIDWITMGAIAVGMLLFFGEELSLTGYWGNILAIFSGMCMALTLISLRKQKDASAMETPLLGNLLAAVIGIPFIFIFDEPINAREISIILYMGVFQLGIPYIIITLAIRQLKVIEAVLIQTLEPILVPLLVLLVIGERPGPLALVGAIIVTTAVVVRGIASARSSDPAEVVIDS